MLRIVGWDPCLNARTKKQRSMKTNKDSRIPPHSLRGVDDGLSANIY